MAQQTSSSYDVFVSFWSEDFHLANFLCGTFSVNRISTTSDYEPSEEENTPAVLENAMEKSRFAIIIISEKYVWFCLDKLSKILDHFKDKVHPVFYHVGPNYVRWMGEAMAVQDNRSDDDDMDRFLKWSMALQQVANLPGSHLGFGDEFSSESILKIVQEVIHKIRYFPIYVAEYPVGVEPRAQKIIQLLDLESGDRVLMVGIYGVARIGKKTLARAVHNLIADQFEVVCFLHNVSKHSNSHGLVHLQKRLLHEIDRRVADDVNNVTCLSEGSEEIKCRLCQKKVLLILDDVDELEQLLAIAGGPDWFGSGSRVITTTEDKNLLASHGIKRIYKVETLNDKEALDLLTWSAFKNDKVDSSYMDVLNHGVNYAMGHSGLLKALGSRMSGKSVVQCESLIDSIVSTRHTEFKEVLGFLDLETAELCIFRDIACCFKGYQLEEVQHTLRAHYSYCVKDYIRKLAHQCQILISSSGEISFLPVVQDMGTEVVRKESPKEPGERSRLGIPKDIVHVLQDCTGTDKIEMICLDYSSTEEEQIDWDGEGFKNMGNIKTLIVKNAHFSQAPRHLPNSLRALEWQRYPSECLPPNFHPKKLSKCKLPKHCFESSKLGDLLKKKPKNSNNSSFDGEHSNEMLHVSCLPKSEEMTVMISHESRNFNWSGPKENFILETIRVLAERNKQLARENKLSTGCGMILDSSGEIP